MNSASTAVTGDSIAVSITLPYDDVAWLPSRFFMPDGNLGSEAVMRRE